ncbi:MAG: ABC transporter substrate-binding protein [Pseudomonadota bacterium]
MRRRNFLGLIGGLPLLPSLGGCGREREPLRIASHVWPGYELMFLARRMGWLDPERVRLAATSSASVSMEKLVNGEVHGAALTLDEVLRLRSAGTYLRSDGLELRVVLVFNISAGADMVIARDDVAGIDDLRGRSIGAEDSALGALMLHHLLERAELERQEVDVVPVTIDEQETAWREGEVDVLITFEPLAGRLLREGARVIFDSRRIPETIFDVLAVRTEYCDSHPGAIRHLTAGHFRALDYMRRNPVDAGYRMAERLDVSGGEAMETFRGLILPDYHANRRLLAADNGRVLSAAREIVAVMDEAGIAVNTSVGSGLITDRFLAQGAE